MTDYVQVWKDQNPPPVMVMVGDETVELSPEEYEAMAQERGPMLEAQAEREQAQAEQTDLEVRVVETQPGLATYAETLRVSAANTPQVEALEGTPPDLVNMPELQVMVADLMDTVNGLIEALEGKGVLTSPPTEIATQPMEVRGE